VDDPLDGRTADRTGFPEPSMHGVVGAEGGDMFREGLPGFAAEAVGRFEQRLTRCVKEARGVFVRELRGQSDRREPRPVKDFVRIRVPDS